MKQWIQIWYSWGSQEAPVEVPEGVDAWQHIKRLAIDEAETAFEGHEDEGEIGMEFYPGESKIILHYNYDGEYCYYKITNTEEFDPDEEDD